MSMATCKCGKVFDSDFQMGIDEKGNCCCDECFEAIGNEFEKDIVNVFDHIAKLKLEHGNIDASATAVDMLLNMGYRKIK